MQDEPADTAPDPDVAPVEGAGDIDPDAGSGDATFAGSDDSGVAQAESRSAPALTVDAPTDEVDDDDDDDDDGREAPHVESDGPDGPADEDALADDEDDDEWPGEVVPPRRNALPRRMESWRNRTASGAIATAIAMGLQQVFEPERRLPAVVAEVPGDPYDEDDPVIVDYVPDDAEATIVTVRPWLMKPTVTGDDVAAVDVTSDDT